MIQRRFHPIGQGAFYSEKHNDLNIVYDCGNWKNTRLSSNVVKQSFSQNDVIYILFISHFDADHVNKINILKDRCLRIDNVVLPLLHENEKRTLINFYLSLGKIDITSLIDNPRVFFGEETNLIFIEPSPNIESESNEFNIENINKNTGGNKITISSNTKIFSKVANWIYIPFNYEYASRKNELENLFIQYRLDITLFQTNLNYTLTNRAKIKKIYNSLTGQINQNSMIVYSGPVANNYKKVFNYHQNYYYQIFFDRPACVYSGDADFNLINVKLLFGKYWDKVGTVQVPHHGDIKCFNTDFFDGREYYCPISVGTNNSYGHPSTNVVSSIFMNNSYPINITESLDSGFIQIIVN